MLRTRTALVGLALCALPLVALTACSSSASPSSGSSSGSSSSSSKSAASKTTGSKSAGSKSSDAGSSSSVARPTDMCALLSPAEAGSVFGGTYGQPYSSDGSCGYAGGNVPFDTFLSPKNVNWATATTIAKVQYGKLTPVSGVGDQALAAPNFLQVRKGSVVFTINDPDGDGTTGPQYIAAAKIMLGHLG